MRDPARIDRILQFVGAYWKQHPDLRLLQLLANLVPNACIRDAYYLEDDKLEEMLQRILQERLFS